MKKLWMVLVGVFLLCISLVSAQKADVYFFHSESCPHCAEQKPWIESMAEKYPDINLIEYEVSEDYETFECISDDFNTIPAGVPRTYVAGKAFVGYDPNPGELEYVKGYEAYVGYQNQIELAILEAIGVNRTGHLHNATCGHEIVQKENVFKVPGIIFAFYLLFFLVFRKKLKKRFLVGSFLGVVIVSLFYIAQSTPNQTILGFAKQFSFPVFTFIIALLDGFNPCAFAVLAVLLSLLIYTKSKKKMALIGIIFILTSGAMYFLFIIILLTLRTELLGGHKEIMRTVVGVIALIAGTINIKDFFFFKKGLSLTISSEKWGKITSKMREIVDKVKRADTPWTLFVAILGTIALAALVNLVELGCTLILPVQYIEVLVTNFGTHVNAPHYIYTAFYNIVYVIPLFFILGTFLYTFESERMSERTGRVLKLIGGLVMIGLGLILLFRPELLVFS